MLHQLVIDSPDLTKVVRLTESYYSLGRHGSNTIVIPSLKVSRKHATLLKKTLDGIERFYILDGDFEGNRSTNGLWVNGEKQLECELKHGDIIVFSQNVRGYYQIIESSLRDPEPSLNNSDESMIEYYPDCDSDNVLQQTIDVSRITLYANQFTEGENLAEEASKLELSKLASVAELSPNPIVEIDLNGTITYVNAAAIKHFPDLYEIHLDHPIFKQLLSKIPHNNGYLSVREIQTNQKFYEQNVHYLTDKQVIRSYFFEITSRKQVEQELFHQAHYDSLTGLPNRTLFNQKLATMMREALQKQEKFAVLFLDIDYFKHINDTLGHNVGDLVLYAFAKRLQSQLRKQDVIARWGGDEFTILLPNPVTAEEIKHVSERVLAALKSPFEIGQHELHIKSSIGIAIYPENGADSETLIKNADAALYRTKALGRNHYQFYTATLSAEISERFQLENALYHALERKEFLLHYQPQINVKTGKIYGVEALIRWQHPEIGLVSPAKFIPIAEENGLIIPIGEWVLKTACQQNRVWQNQGFEPLKIGVNLSAKQLQQPNLVKSIAQILEQSSVDPHLLELEITETAIMENTSFARQILDEIRAIGVHISMDDFGTGYSSLGYLKQFPFHTLKIDQTFVRELQETPEDIAIISAVIALGQGFNMRVVAEGVETQQQLNLLQGLNCEQMQGYWFSRPLSVQDITDFIQNQVLG